MSCISMTSHRDLIVGWGEMSDLNTIIRINEGFFCLIL